MKLRADQLEDADIEREESAELKKLSDLELALETHKRMMAAMLAEIQAGIRAKCQYKFSVVRDENRLITEILATPIKDGG